MKKFMAFGGLSVVANMLRVDVKSGLDEFNYEDINERKKHFGENHFVITDKRSIFRYCKHILLRERFRHLIILTLVIIALRCI